MRSTVLHSPVRERNTVGRIIRKWKLFLRSLQKKTNLNPVLKNRMCPFAWVWFHFYMSNSTDFHRSMWFPIGTTFHQWSPFSEPLWQTNLNCEPFRWTNHFWRRLVDCSYNHIREHFRVSNSNQQDIYLLQLQFS